MFSSFHWQNSQSGKIQTNIIRKELASEHKNMKWTTAWTDDKEKKNVCKMKAYNIKEYTKGFIFSCPLKEATESTDWQNAGFVEKNGMLWLPLF